MILFIVRMLITAIWMTFVYIFSTVICLLRFRSWRNASLVSNLIAKASKIFGIRVIQKHSKWPSESCVFVANHQNIYDMLTLTSCLRPGAVTIGKKDILKIPFFGQIYWQNRNIAIDRKDKVKAYNTLKYVVDLLKKQEISVMVFPEGTRSRGRGLLPFKVGAFRIAIEAQVPIVPICASDLTNIDPKKWSNGYVLIESLDPISTKGLTTKDSRMLSNKVHEMMKIKIEELSKKAKQMSNN